MKTSHCTTVHKKSLKRHGKPLYHFDTLPSGISEQDDTPHTALQNRDTILHSMRTALHREKTIESIFTYGKALTALKISVPHGEFLPQLTRRGISRSSAENYMTIYQTFHSRQEQAALLGVAKLVILSRFDPLHIEQLLAGQAVDTLTLAHIRTLSVRAFEAVYRRYRLKYHKKQYTLADDFDSSVNDAVKMPDALPAFYSVFTPVWVHDALPLSYC